MGMFNYVEFEDECMCGGKISDFQTKDSSNEELLCLTVLPQSVKEFYGTCEKCDKWFDYYVDEDMLAVTRSVEVKEIKTKRILL